MTPTTPSPNYGPTPDQLFAGCQCVEAAGGFDPFIGEVLAEVNTVVMRRLREAGDPQGMTAGQICEQIGDLRGLAGDILEQRMRPDIKREIRQAVDADLAANPVRDSKDVERRIDAVEKRMDALMELRFDALGRALMERSPYKPRQ